MTTEQLVQARARAKATHIYLDAGLVDDARGALGRLLEDLGEGLAAEANGGGSEMPTAAEVGQTIVSAVVGSEPALEREGRRVGKALSEALAAKKKPGRRATQRSSVQGPTGTDALGRRSRRKFSEDEQKDGVSRARSIGVAAAAREIDVAPSVLRGWMAKHPDEGE